MGKKQKPLTAVAAGTKPIVVVGILLVLSLATAFVLFYFFDSFAEIENKGVKLGGAMAGFVAIFFLLRHTYFKLVATGAIDSAKFAQEKIEFLEAQLTQALIGTLDNFVVPNGYRPEVSPEFRFGICVPESWIFIPFPELTLIGSAVDVAHAKELGFARNVNINVTHVDASALEDKNILEQERNFMLSMLPESSLVVEEHFLCQGLPAYRKIINYHPRDRQELTGYQVQVVNPAQEQLLTITYTTLKDDFEKSRSTFENILGTLRLSGASSMVQRDRKKIAQLASTDEE